LLELVFPVVDDPSLKEECGGIRAELRPSRIKHRLRSFSAIAVVIVGRVGSNNETPLAALRDDVGAVPSTLALALRLLDPPRPCKVQKMVLGSQSVRTISGTAWDGLKQP